MRHLIVHIKKTNLCAFKVYRQYIFASMIFLGIIPMHMILRKLIWALLKFYHVQTINIAHIIFLGIISMHMMSVFIHLHTCMTCHVYRHISAYGWDEHSNHITECTGYNCKRLQERINVLIKYCVNLYNFLCRCIYMMQVIHCPAISNIMHLMKNFRPR